MSAFDSGSGTAGIYDSFSIFADSTASPTCATYGGKSGSIQYDTTSSTYVSLTFITLVTPAVTTTDSVTGVTTTVPAVYTYEVWLLKSLI
jgi:hypothetical protein